jgi:single-stranded-DNA-specific exonuclease
MHPVAQALWDTRNIDVIDYDARPDPFLMRDMDVAVERILKAIRNKEKVAAWTDYDCDGIPAGALLADFFKMINYPLRSYIPDRSEGYSLNKPGLEKLKDEGVSLIITADCGITDVKEVEYANALGIDVIISDHHLPLHELPPALAVLNPHRTDNTYPFTELCGTGVAFKLVEALAPTLLREEREGQVKWLLDLVALATVADMVSLTGENRTLVHWGLKVMHKGRRKGLRTLLDAMRVPLMYVTEDDIAFSIAPKINASSRMESPLLGLELLTTDDDARAKELAKKLIDLNGARKLEGARVGKEVKKRLDGAVLSSVVVMGHSTWNPALLGIAATSVVETYQRTVCLWGKDGDLIKGSCRSDGTVNIVSLMSSAKHLFEDYGGHELSGGFSLKADAIHTLPLALEEAYASLKTEVVYKEQQTDGTLTVGEVTDGLYDSLRTLAPFGIGNKKPVFRFIGTRVERILMFGSGKEHMRITLCDSEGHDTIDAVSFFSSREPFHPALELLAPGDCVTLDASVERSYFGNKKELRLRIENLAVQ